MCVLKCSLFQHKIVSWSLHITISKGGRLAITLSCDKHNFLQPLMSLNTNTLQARSSRLIGVIRACGFIKYQFNVDCE